MQTLSIRKLVLVYCYEIKQTLRKKRQIWSFHNDKKSIHQKYITILNVHIPINRVLKYQKQANKNLELERNRQMNSGSWRLNSPTVNNCRPSRRKNSLRMENILTILSTI